MTENSSDNIKPEEKGILYNLRTKFQKTPNNFFIILKAMDYIFTQLPIKSEDIFHRIQWCQDAVFKVQNKIIRTYFFLMNNDTIMSVQYDVICTQKMNDLQIAFLLYITGEKNKDKTESEFRRICFACNSIQNSKRKKKSSTTVNNAVDVGNIFIDAVEDPIGAMDKFGEQSTVYVNNSSVLSAADNTISPVLDSVASTFKNNRFISDDNIMVLFESLKITMLWSIDQLLRKFINITNLLLESADIFKANMATPGFICLHLQVNKDFPHLVEDVFNTLGEIRDSYIFSPTVLYIITNMALLYKLWNAGQALHKCHKTKGISSLTGSEFIQLFLTGIDIPFLRKNVTYFFQMKHDILNNLDKILMQGRGNWISNGANFLLCMISPDYVPASVKANKHAMDYKMNSGLNEYKKELFDLHKIMLFFILVFTVLFTFMKYVNRKQKAVTETTQNILVGTIGAEKKISSRSHRSWRKIFR